MGEFRFDKDAYLERVGLGHEPPVDEAGLGTLHTAQFFSIPFENFDIQLGRRIDLDPAALFAKLVARPRGGYCFELNGLMLMALRAFGFAARPLLARVHLESTPSGRTHQLNLVDLNGRPWIIDVGFGAGGLRAPMPLETGRTQDGPGCAFRLERREPWGFLLRTREDGQRQDSYSFDLSRVIPADIAVANHYTSTSPDTHFTFSRVASLPNEGGRVSIRNFTLTENDADGKRTCAVEPGGAYLDVLKRYFGIELDAAYDDLRPVTDKEPESG
jgi:N-hydroxyarylamine O-acetyltransferase